MFTVVDPEIRRTIETGCYTLEVPCVLVLDGVMSGLAALFGPCIAGQPG